MFPRTKDCVERNGKGSLLEFRSCDAGVRSRNSLADGSLHSAHSKVGIENLPRFAKARHLGIPIVIIKPARYWGKGERVSPGERGKGEKGQSVHMCRIILT